MISFTDVLKGEIMAEFSAISSADMLTAIGLSFLLSLFIVFIYRITFSGVSFSFNFACCIVMISMVTALVIQVITSNVVLSLGMVGALSIVRFRTAVKEPSDTAFLFWAIATGIICGAGYITVSILSAVLLGLLFIAFYVIGRNVKTNSYMVVVRIARDSAAEAQLTSMPGYKMKNKTVTDDMIELVSEMRLNKSGIKKLTALQEQEGVREVSIMKSVSGSVL